MGVREVPNQSNFQQQPLLMPIDNMNSNQLARNNRNYDKLRGGNVLAGGPSVNQANNTSNNNISMQ